MENFNREGKREGRSGPRRDYDRRDSRPRGSDSRGPREMHDAVCDECGKDCQVPFVPTGGKPIYCSACFEKKDGGSSSPRNSNDRGSRRPNDDKRHAEGPRNNPQLEVISLKLDKMIDMLTALSTKEVGEVETKPIEVIIVEQEKPKVIKKKTPVKKK